MEKKPIFDDPELQAEHDALHEIACIVAEKWKADLERADCSFSMDGIMSIYDITWKYDRDAFKTLVDGHNKRIEEYRKRKKEERRCQQAQTNEP